MPKKNLIQKRNDKIKEEYQKKKKEGKHTPSFIQDKLSEKYYLSVKTIQKIIYES